MTEFNKQMPQKAKKMKQAKEDALFKTLSAMSPEELEAWMERNGSDSYQMRKLLTMIIRVVTGLANR